MSLWAWQYSANGMSSTTQDQKLRNQNYTSFLQLTHVPAHPEPNLKIISKMF